MHWRLVSLRMTCYYRLPPTCHCPTSLSSARNKADSRTWRRMVRKIHCPTDPRSAGQRSGMGKILGKMGDGTRASGLLCPLYLLYMDLGWWLLWICSPHPSLNPYLCPDLQPHANYPPTCWSVYNNEIKCLRCSRLLCPQTYPDAKLLHHPMGTWPSWGHSHTEPWITFRDFNLADAPLLMSLERFLSG